MNDSSQTSVRSSLISWLERHAAELDGVILDIDGVLLRSGRQLHGSRDLLALLQRIGLPFVLLTNDGNHSTEEKALGLQRAGLNIAPSAIVSCGHAMAPLAREKGYCDRPFFVMGDSGDPCYVRAAGLIPVRDLAQLKNCEGVIVGEDHYAWEAVINAVVNFFIDTPQAPLIVPNPDEFYPGHTLKLHIAAGGVARFIQHVLAAYGLSIAPIYLGKPFTAIFQMAVRRLEQLHGATIAANRTLMIGDNLQADIAGGLQAGLRTALLLTGVTTASTLAEAEIRPDLCFIRL